MVKFYDEIDNEVEMVVDYNLSSRQPVFISIDGNAIGLTIYQVEELIGELMDLCGRTVEN